MGSLVFSPSPSARSWGRSACSPHLQSRARIHLFPSRAAFARSTSPENPPAAAHRATDNLSLAFDSSSRAPAPPAAHRFAHLSSPETPVPRLVARGLLPALDRFVPTLPASALLSLASRRRTWAAPRSQDYSTKIRTANLEAVVKPSSCRPRQVGRRAAAAHEAYH